MRQRLVQFVAMDTLEYLQKGSRMGSVVKWVGKLLQVKPQVPINHHTGQVESDRLARSHKQLMEMFYKKNFFERLTGRGGLHVAVLHGNTLEEAQALAERIRSEWIPTELLINTTGLVLEINTGPGALALCGYAEV